VEAIHVTAAITDYDVLVGCDILSKFPDLLAGFDPGGELVVVTDDGVDNRYPALPFLSRDAHRVVLKSGEHLKSLDRAVELIQKLAGWKVSREGMIIALGGGVIGDLAGFVASIYLRGIRWTVIPTTLLSQVDSSIGGKVAVNLPHGKNLVGAFFPPRLVVCDVAFLAELPESEFVSGLGEVIKTALIGDQRLFEMLESKLDAILARDADALQTVVAACVKVKADVVSKDERDRGERAVLNLGHTIAHALEAAQGFEDIPHGVAVLLGILAVLPLSGTSCGLSDETADRIRRLIGRLPIEPPSSLPPIDLIEPFLAYDKKVRDRNVRWVLLKNIGVPVSGVTVPVEQVRSAYKSLSEVR
jgi:3-dehydroquinate synthase